MSIYSSKSTSGALTALSIKYFSLMALFLSHPLPPLFPTSNFSSISPLNSLTIYSSASRTFLILSPTSIFQFVVFFTWAILSSSNFPAMYLLIWSSRIAKLALGFEYMSYLPDSTWICWPYVQFIWGGFFFCSIKGIQSFGFSRQKLIRTGASSGWMFT